MIRRINWLTRDQSKQRMSMRMIIKSRRITMRKLTLMTMIMAMMMTIRKVKQLMMTIELALKHQRIFLKFISGTKKLRIR